MGNNGVKRSRKARSDSTLIIDTTRAIRQAKNSTFNSLSKVVTLMQSKSKKDTTTVKLLTDAQIIEKNRLKEAIDEKSEELNKLVKELTNIEPNSKVTAVAFISQSIGEDASTMLPISIDKEEYPLILLSRLFDSFFRPQYVTKYRKAPHTSFKNKKSRKSSNTTHQNDNDNDADNDNDNDNDDDDDDDNDIWFDLESESQIDDDSDSDSENFMYI